jgi:hypothetical protein
LFERKLQLASLEWTFLNLENFDEGFDELLLKLRAELEFQEKEGTYIFQAINCPLIFRWGEWYGACMIKLHRSF